jgi:uncharacterized protein (TIGR02646 family)
MRPVIRGECPCEEDGSRRTYTDYSRARADLIKRLGQYCSYCKMNLDASLAVEHVLPKKPKDAAEIDNARALSWENFLLACTNCNSTKSQKECADDEIYWPDKANTFYYLTYKEGGLVSCRDALEEPSKSKIQATIDLVGLDRTPPDGGAEKDRRWKNRREAWDIAVESKQDLGESDSSAMRRQVVRTAVAQGYWSVWMTVFHDDTDILSKLIQGFVGTGADCFDPAGNYSAIETVRV